MGHGSASVGIEMGTDGGPATQRPDDRQPGLLLGFRLKRLVRGRCFKSWRRVWASLPQSSSRSNRRRWGTGEGFGNTVLRARAARERSVERGKTAATAIGFRHRWPAAIERDSKACPAY